MLFGHLPIGTGGVARSSLFVLSPQPHQEFQSTQNWDEVSGEAATPRGWDRLKFGSCLDGCEGGCLGGVQGRIGQAGRQVSGIWRGSRWGTRHLCVSENPPSINSECWIDWSGEARIPDYWIRGTRFLPKLTSARSNMRSERSTNQSQWHLWCRDAWGERGRVPVKSSTVEMSDDAESVCQLWLSSCDRGDDGRHSEIWTYRVLVFPPASSSTWVSSAFPRFSSKAGGTRRVPVNLWPL